MIIHSRIVDNIDELKLMTKENYDLVGMKITGFFQFSFGGHDEGCYYHENVLNENETGGELLDYWFDSLLDSLTILYLETEYVAIKEIETLDRWIEFRRISDSVIINVVIDESKEIDELLVVNSQDGFTYLFPRNFATNINELKKMILLAFDSFINELCQINTELIKTNKIKKLILKAEEISKIS